MTFVREPAKKGNVVSVRNSACSKTIVSTVRVLFRQRGHKFTCLRRLPSSADRIAGRATTLWPAATPSTSWQKNPRSYRNLRPSHSSHLWPFRRKRLAAPQPSCRGDLRRLVRILHESPFEAAWPPTTTWPAANASNTP